MRLQPFRGTARVPEAARKSRGTLCRTAAFDDRRIASGLAATALSISLLLSPGSVGATTGELAGPARVVDGDTLEVQGQKIRLYGIDAPEKAQPCKDTSGNTYSCGLLSKEALAAKIGTKPVQCTIKNQDQYGRNVSVCTVGGGLLGGQEEINSWLVSNGYAVAYRQYGKEYIPLEEEAKAAHRGVWNGDFQMPNEWRKDQKAGLPAASQAALPGSVAAALMSQVGMPQLPQLALPGTVPGAAAPVASVASVAGASRDVGPPCPGGALAIKGNINGKNEKIYHVPGGSLYEKVKIDVEDGERWFCTRAEAEAAGWRASKS